MVQSLVLTKIKTPDLPHDHAPTVLTPDNTGASTVNSGGQKYLNWKVLFPMS